MKPTGNLKYRLIFVALFGLALSASAGGAGGEELFVTNCAPCHGKDGKAKTPIARKLGVKDLTQCKLTDVEIEKQILAGKRDDHGKEKMPSFQGKLSDEEIKAIIAVVNELRK